MGQRGRAWHDENKREEDQHEARGKLTLVEANGVKVLDRLGRRRTCA